MEDTLRAVAEILGGIAFLWSAYQERRHRKKAKSAKSLGEAAKSGPFETQPVRGRK